MYIIINQELQIVFSDENKGIITDFLFKQDDQDKFVIYKLAKDEFPTKDEIIQHKNNLASIARLEKLIDFTLFEHQMSEEMKQNLIRYNLIMKTIHEFETKAGF